MDSYVGQFRHGRVYLDDLEEGTVASGRVTVYSGWVKVEQGDSQHPIIRFYPAHRVILVSP